MMDHESVACIERIDVKCSDNLTMITTVTEDQIKLFYVKDQTDL